MVQTTTEDGTTTTDNERGQWMPEDGSPDVTPPQQAHDDLPGEREEPEPAPIMPEEAGPVLPVSTEPDAAAIGPERPAPVDIDAVPVPDDLIAPKPTQETPDPRVTRPLNATEIMAGLTLIPGVRRLERPQPNDRLPAADPTGGRSGSTNDDDESPVIDGLVHREPGSRPAAFQPAPLSPSPSRWQPPETSIADDTEDGRTVAFERYPQAGADPWAYDDGRDEDDEAERTAEVRGARRRRVRTLVRDIVEMTLLGLLVFLVVKASVHRYRVEGESMYPTIEDGQQFIVNKIAYAEIDLSKIPGVDGGDDPVRDVWGGPERGDVIVFNDPRGGNQDLIKRVIGLPGDTLEIRDGAVYINGYRLIEDYIVAPWGGSEEAITLPVGYYFVMGDNRNNSTDSRVFGPIDREIIIGQTLLGVWPTGNLGLAPNESPTCEDVPSCEPDEDATVSAP